MTLRQDGFTLIELLVVITIIVVLLSLLAPALDQAIYQAELAVCATTVRGIAEGATLYAAANKRSYPYRQRFMPNGNHKTSRPKRLWNATGNKNYIDERPYIRPYVASINKQFQCPFLPEMDLDVPDIEKRPAGQIANASYQFWYGWQYSANVGGTIAPTERGMFRLGDRFTYTTNTYTADVGRQYSFDVIANDFDMATFPEGQSPWNDTSSGSHPDKAPGAVMSVLVEDFQPLVPGVPEGGTSSLRWSRWQGPYARGVIDMNVARTDNSVNRYTDVVFESSAAGRLPDERMVRIPEGDADEWPDWRNNLPPAGG